MNTVPFPTKRSTPKSDGRWVDSDEDTPIVHMDFLTREDGSQYARTEYENGYIEFHERDEWLALGRFDFWKAGGLEAAMEAKVREFHEANSSKEIK